MKLHPNACCASARETHTRSDVGSARGGERGEVERVATRTARGIARLLARRGLIDADPAEADPLVH